MNDIRLCPYCNKSIDIEETIDTEWEGGTYYDVVVGFCPKCKRKFKWTDIYYYHHSEDFHEIKS